MLELAILIPFVLWSIDQSQKGQKQNEAQNLAIQELHHCIDNVATSLEHHIQTSEIRLDATANVIDKIWNKLE